MADDRVAGERSRDEFSDDSESAVTAPAQDSAWFFATLFPEVPVGTVCRAFRVSGQLDVAALGAAWHAVTARQDVLRTRIVETGGRLRAVVGPPPDAPLASTDLADLTDLADRPGADREPGAARWLAERAAVPVDLAGAPPARVEVLRLAPTEHLVLVVAHAVAVDQRSMSILVDELSACYGAEVGGPAASVALRQPATRFRDLAARARAWESSAEYRELADRAVAALTPPPAPVTLPTDRRRPVTPATAAGTVEFTWSAALGDGITDLADAHGTTPLVVLLAATLCLLHRHSGQDELTVGVPMSTRPGDGRADRLIGPFDNPVVIRADLADRPTFGALVDRVATLAQHARALRAVPFANVVRESALDRDVRRHPGYDIAVAMTDEPSPLRLYGTETTEQRVPAGATLLDLALTVERVVPAPRGTLTYRADLFDARTARELTDQLRVLLGAALADPARSVATLPLATPPRVRAALRAADRRTAHPARHRADQLVLAHARTSPAATAITAAGVPTSYQELADRATAIAAALRAGGTGPGDAVVVRIGTGADQYAALLGCLLAGTHLTWCGTGDAGERGRTMLTDLRPACLLLDRDPATDPLATWYRDELGGRLLDLTAPLPTGSAVTRPAALDALAYVAYTSGSTGRPKGIPQTHGALVQFAAWLGRRFAMGPGARVAQWVAPEHDPALAEVFATLVAGGTLCAVPERARVHPERLVDWLVAERITHLQTVPSFARELLGVIAALDPPRRPVLSHLLLMGEAVPGDLVNGLRAALPRVRVVNLYGPTETIVGTWHEVTGPVAGTVPIGRSVPGRQVLVLDDQDQPCPTGVTGEIVIRTPFVTPGYLDASRPEVFRPVAGLAPAERAYRTGDLGRYRWDGLLEFAGRKDFQVKLLGNRYELTDIEAALAEHDSVAECVVVPVRDRDGLVRGLAAYVVPTTEADRLPGRWRAHLRGRLGKVLPITFTVLAERLPRNLAGKVDRRRLPDPAPVTGDSRPPEPGTAAELAAIWTELLGPDRPIGAEDGFFAVGGHSLLVPRLARAVRAAFDVDIPLWEFFANPSLAGMSALIRSASHAEKE